MLFYLYEWISGNGFTHHSLAFCTSSADLAYKYQPIYSICRRNFEYWWGFLLL